MQALKLMLFTMLIAGSMSIFAQNSAYFEHRWYGFYEDYSDVLKAEWSWKMKILVLQKK